mgnify:CR=1 FL=1
MAQRMSDVRCSSVRCGMAKHHVILACAGVALAGLFLAWSLGWTSTARSPAEVLRLARAALRKGEFKEAETLALSVPEDHSKWIPAMLVAGEAATRDGRLQDAAELYGKIPLGTSEDKIMARFSMAEVLLHSGQLTAAERAYREVIQHQPNYIDAYSRLSFVLSVSGRRRESGAPLFSVLRSGSAKIDELILLADLERPVDESAFLQDCRKQGSDDVLVHLGLATHTAANGDMADAIRILKMVIGRQSELEAAQCLLGELLVEADGQEFSKWYDQLPLDAQNWPDLWFVLGRRAAHSGQLEMAARCFWEAVRRVPIFRRANYELGLALTRLNIAGADRFSERSDTLLELSTWLTYAKESQGTNEQAMQEVVGRLEKLGRIWEACAWASLSRQIFPNSNWYQSVLSRNASKLVDGLPLTPDEQSFTSVAEVSEFPLFRLDVATATTSSVQDNGSTTIHFQHEEKRGLNFVYQNANDETTAGARIQEQTGGGCSVVDLDNDSWPDLYFVQGGEWRHGSSSAEILPDYADQMFRNRRGAQFDNVTEQAGIVELGFGQSCAVGDLNEDGFADLYIANIGSNTLYLSNGDGTFQKSADQSAFCQDLFTSSAAIADIDGNGFADVFDANYVTGNDVYHRICDGRACSPINFDGVVDQLHLNYGDGHFSSIAASTPIDDAKGLGVVVSSLGDPLRPSIFVANDQTPNFLLTLSDSNELLDSGLRSGLAYNQDGLVTAAMGIAADDVNNDGLIDFFVTNFQDESNCLYLQTGNGFFVDATVSAGLRAPSWPYVGWGTQFFDADLDGDMDLVLTNGHVDGYTADGQEAEMRSQFFQKIDGVKFQELSPEQTGPFFAKKYFGRALLKLDWNRDGLMDFLVVPNGVPVALVTNATTSHGHFVNIRLHATNSARDAICSFVQVEAAGNTWKKQLFAGDGYHASNERILQFGLGDANQIDRIVVSWPSGNQSRIESPPADSTLEFVEGLPVATAWKNETAETLSVSVVGKQRHQTVPGNDLNRK